MTQQPNQPVEDYICKLQQKALRANLTEEQTRYSMIHGLKPAIRQAVLQHDPTSVTDIRKWALIAESSSLEREQPDLGDLIKRMDETLQKMQLRSEVHETQSPTAST